MCTRTPEGYLLSTGKVVPYHNADLTKLTPSEFNDLASEKVSMLEMVSVRDTQFKMSEDIKKVSSNVDKVLKEIKQHRDFCPINKDAIELQVIEILDDKIDDSVKKSIKSSILSAGNLSKAVMGIVALFIFLGGILYAIYNFLGLKI